MAVGVATNGYAVRTRTRELMRIATAGSVDDGKSTLIGRLLYDTKTLFEDQLAYIATHAEDRVLLYDAAFQPLVERMKSKWPTIEHYVCFETDYDGWLAAQDGVGTVITGATKPAQIEANAA